MTFFLMLGLSINAESDDEFEMNSEEENNSDPLNDVEVLILFDFVFSCAVVQYNNMIYIVAFCRTQIP